MITEAVVPGFYSMVVYQLPVLGNYPEIYTLLLSAEKCR